MRLLKTNDIVKKRGGNIAMVTFLNSITTKRFNVLKEKSSIYININKFIYGASNEKLFKDII
jgi:hypothetical protein